MNLCIFVHAKIPKIKTLSTRPFPLGFSHSLTSSQLNGTAVCHDLSFFCTKSTPVGRSVKARLTL